MHLFNVQAIHLYPLLLSNCIITYPATVKRIANNKGILTVCTEAIAISKLKKDNIQQPFANDSSSLDPCDIGKCMKMWNRGPGGTGTWNLFCLLLRLCLLQTCRPIDRSSHYCSIRYIFITIHIDTYLIISMKNQF